MTKNCKKWRILTTKNGLKTYFWWVFGHVWTEFFMLVNLPPTLIMNYIFLGQKSSIDFSPHFSPFYPDRVTSESYNNPLKVIPEGSMVEYLPVGSKESKVCSCRSAVECRHSKFKFPPSRQITHELFFSGDYTMMNSARLRRWDWKHICRKTIAYF